MLRIKPFVIFVSNIVLLALSWLFHISPHGDEYLILFVIPILCVIAPYILKARMLAVMVVSNLLFLLIYYSKGILDSVDLMSFTILITVSSGVSYLVMVLSKTFREYNKNKIDSIETEYNHIVKDLEGVERKGRIIERELGRISRLYEVTKQFGSVLRFDSITDTLFRFLDDNFELEKVHFMVFDNGKFAKGVSRIFKDLSKPGEKRPFDYKKFVEYMKSKEYKQFFAERNEGHEIFSVTDLSSFTFAVFPLFVKTISAILAIEGMTKIGYNRLDIVTSQIALEMRKVELYEEVEKLAILDGLTGVYLRRYLMERLNKEVDRAGRLNLTFSIGMIDIDNFKHCNDRYGHLVGDAVLREVSDRLKKSVREVDMIARYGGEEFCIVLPETGKDLATQVAERLRKNVEKEKIEAFDEKMTITVSAGIATYPDDGKDVSHLIEAADTLLYKAKRKGKNQVCSV